MTYDEFLREKVRFDRTFGFEPGPVNPILKGHQAQIVQWAVRGGRRAIFAAFGLGKSVMQLEVLRLILAEKGGRALIIAPLGVRQEFRRDAAMLGQSITFVRWTHEVDGPGLYLTNYESIRDGRLDPSLFVAVSLDEASVLRSYGSKTYQSFLDVLSDIPYRFVATATPSPNRFKELIHYAGFLGIMDTGQALTRFFQRDSTKANNLTLHPHKRVEFHLWLSTWAAFLQRPSDICECSCHAHTPPSKASGSEGSRPRRGAPRLSATAPGSVNATVAEVMSSQPRTCDPEESSVADASGPGMEVKELGHTTSGDQCMIGAGDQITRTGPTTAAEELPSANVGMNSPTSSQTWASHQTDTRSTASTTTATTSPGTAAGRRPASRPTTGGHAEGPCPCDDGYVLPAIDVRFHEVAVDHLSGAQVDRDGQAHLFKGAALGVVGAAREKRETLDARVAKMAELVNESPADHFILWHDLEDERRAIKRALPDAVEVFGTLDLDVREQRIIDFSEGRSRLLATKPEISGSGCNFQRHCHRAIFVGVGFDFNDFYQAVHRIHRFQQDQPVRIDIIHAESEREVVRTLMEKWRRHEELTENMTDVIREHGLDPAAISEALTRSMGVERVEVSGEGWLVANNDCVIETQGMDENSVDLIVTSIPFSNHYEYTPSYNDFGHTDDNDHFWSQMDYLTPELLRVLRPGRVYACHVKDRILFGNVTGAGIPTVSPFHAEALMHGRRHGFDYMGMITVVTDVVRENNQTYRLGWTEMSKDGTKMGVGSPEYILLFHKPQTDRSRGYADTPVTKDKQRYTRARWQVDAHAFWRSSGDRPVTPEELAAMPVEQRSKAFTEQTLREIYDYESHIKVGEILDGKGALPATFMSLAPGSWHPEVWHDVNRMLTLNTEQSRRAQTMHVCLARGSLVLTRGGYKPIEQVVVGEHVLTHRGRWRPVLAVQNTGIRPVVELRAQGVAGLVLTPDHKVWARDSRRFARQADYMRQVEPDWLAAGEAVGAYVNRKLPEVEPTVVSDHHWWIVGRWLADGHWSERGSLAISCGSHEMEDLRARLGKHAGRNYRTTAGEARQIRLRDRGGDLRRIIKACGRGATGKHLPPEAFTLPASSARALLDGYLSGDGHYLPDRRRWMASSVSRELLLGMALLAQRAYGATASVYRGRPARTGVVMGRTVSMRQDWIFSFDIQDGRRKGSLILDDGAWMRVRAADPAGEEETWNLRVEEDESYTAEGMIVKNCPLQFDIVDRLIGRFSNPGELVFDPFGGLFTVPVRALHAGRRGRGVELNPGYFLDGVKYLQAEERNRAMPSLFEVAS